MTARSKLLLVGGLLLAVAAALYLGSGALEPEGVRVQTETVGRRPLVQVVTASGEITPVNYVNVGAEQMGRITEILVAEGDTVRRGQLLARLEAVQPRADVDAQQASLEQLRSDLRAAGAAIEAGEAAEAALAASLKRTQAEQERADLLYDRASKLLEDGLIARDEYDRRRADARTAEAYVAEAQANIVRLQAERQELLARQDGAQRRIEQAEAQLRRVRDVLRRHSYLSPIDGVVTNLPVKTGETVVPGIQNSPASLLMTIADLSVITAEALVDETDVVHVELAQPAEISIDALPDAAFSGRVTEIGNTAILRSSGLSASQSTSASQEARDFETTVALDDPADTLRPGMSCTVRITTATRDRALTIPIQALAVRNVDDQDREGVFVVSTDRVARFVPVQTGISGGGALEVTAGLDEGDEIVIGGYEALRALTSETFVRVETP